MLPSLDVDKIEQLIKNNELINSEFSDVNSLLVYILETAAALCGGEASSIILYDEISDRLYFEVALGSKGAEVSRFSLDKNEGIAGWVFEHKKSLIIDDVQKDDRFFSLISKNVDYPTKTMLAVPMSIKNKCVGVIEILNKIDGNYFNNEDLKWLEIFANQAAIAIQNAKRFESLSNRLSQLQEQVEEKLAFNPIITKNRHMLDIIDFSKKIATTDSSVLIYGESGTGKELVADLIHFESKRKNNNFVKVNCAAIPESLIESELFGHVKGAFTDAIRARKGRFEMAHEGTIFLDEVAELPLSMQAKLLRVIQYKSFEPVGSSETITVNIRILAATNKNLEDLVEQKQFRSDLFYRLNVLPLTIPPLRQRQDDIIELAEHFLEIYAKETKKKFSGFSEQAIQILNNYSWPGNVRELQNVIERACVISDGGLINSGELMISTIDIESSNFIIKHDTLKDAVNTFKKKYIKKVLADCNGNQTETANILDIQRTYLSRLIKELELHQ